MTTRDSGRRTRAPQRASASALAQQLSTAVEGIVAHIARLEQGSRAGADSARLAETERALKR